MMMIVKWHDRELLCRQREKDGIMGCVGCRYDLGDQCDEASTDFVLATSANAFREYFAEINYMMGKPKQK